MSYSIDRNTGHTFKRTGSNFPIGSISRVKVQRKQNLAFIIREHSDTSTIISLATVLARTI